MQISNFGNRPQRGGRLRRFARQVSLDRAINHFQGVLLYLDYFGFCAALTTSLFAFFSFFLQAAHSGAQEGVI
jgi:hypothetical protein